MQKLVQLLCRIIADRLQSQPQISTEDLVTAVRAQIANDDRLQKLFDDTKARIVQNNSGEARGYQVRVEGGVVYVGNEKVFNISGDNVAGDKVSGDKYVYNINLILKQLELAPIVIPNNINRGSEHFVGRDAVNALVKQTCKAIRKKIRTQCGTMKVLDMQHPIDLTGENGIYTDVNILKELTKNRFAEDVLPRSLNNQILDNRWGLGNIVERLPGLKVVEDYSRLLVLGKPGAGKTTFLKYIAMQCIAGKLQRNKVPFFVNLRDFAHENQQTNIVEYLAGSLPSDRIQLFDGRNPVEIVELLLQQGRCLILLDGLDEVRREDTSRINREIRKAADEFDRSQFVITCRIAAQEYVFERFTEVEVADFDDRQVHTFARNWFRARFDFQGANSFEQRLQRFEQRLQEDKSIRELASNPLLLTLMCFVFSENGEFPNRRADLYEQGVNILLRRWDASRNIDRDAPYRNLDVQRREDLLSFVAFQTFSRGELILRKCKIKNHISDFLVNLRNLGPRIQRADSEAVLRSIESQHGLLVERARGFYSFSHLTLQEYFVAREINLTNQPIRHRELLKLLAEKFSDSRWREVLLLMMEMLRNASSLLLEIKKEIDSQVAEDKKIQSFLQWVCEKSHSVSTKYKITGVRAFYYDLTLSLGSEFAWKIDSSFDSNSNFDLRLDYLLIVALNRAMADAVLDLHLELNNVLVHINENDALRNTLCKLHDRLPRDTDKMRSWRLTEGQSWVGELRECIIDYRNIGQDLDFSPEQEQALRQYHSSSLFLWECLNTDCYVDRNIREYIQETLLLPVIEIEKIKIERGLEF
jgi:predicted NACHT family NTPase